MSGGGLIRIEAPRLDLGKHVVEGSGNALGFFYRDWLWQPVHIDSVLAGRASLLGRLSEMLQRLLRRRHGHRLGVALGDVRDHRHYVFGEPAVIVLLLGDVGRVVRVLDTDALYPCGVRAQVMHLRVSHQGRRAASCLKGFSKLVEIARRVALNFEVVALPTEQLEAAVQSVLQSPYEVVQLAIGQPDRL